MELSHESAPATPAPEIPLHEEVKDALLRLRPAVMNLRLSATTDGLEEMLDQACRDQADAVMTLLVERGHYLPGAPPAVEILKDAKTFAERLTLSNLALRCFAMLGSLAIDTPETKPAKRWIVDYIEGKNHGPVGYPMLWPAKMPGLAQMLRDWGFEPTPTVPSYVSRALPNPTMQ